MISYFGLAIMCFFFGLIYILRKDQIIEVLSRIHEGRKRYVRFEKNKTIPKSNIMPLIMNIVGLSLLLCSLISCIAGFLMYINQTT